MNPKQKKEDGFWYRVTYKMAILPRKYGYMFLAASILFLVLVLCHVRPQLANPGFPGLITCGILFFIGVMCLITSVIMVFIQKVRADIRKELNKSREEMLKNLKP